MRNALASIGYRGAFPFFFLVEECAGNGDEARGFWALQRRGSGLRALHVGGEGRFRVWGRAQ